MFFLGISAIHIRLCQPVMFSIDFYSSCPDIRCMYLLIREKKGKFMDQRLKEMFNDPVCVLACSFTIKYFLVSDLL